MSLGRLYCQNSKYPSIKKFVVILKRVLNAFKRNSVLFKGAKVSTIAVNCSRVKVLSLSVTFTTDAAADAQTAGFSDSSHFFVNKFISSGPT